MNLMYILILVIETNGYPVSISQTEYLNLDSCNKAKEKIERKYNEKEPFKIYGTCEKK